MAKNPWTDPDPQPGDFDSDLEDVDPRHVEVHEGNPNAKLTIVAGVEGSDATAIDELRAALTDADGWLAVETRLRESASDEDARKRVRPFVFAFGYMLLHDEERRAEEGPFGPIITTDQGQFPPAVADIDPADVEMWRRAADEIDAPIAVSRLRDLLWIRREAERPDRDARAAADAYIELTRNPSWHAIERVDCLTRALELTRAISDAERQAAVVERAVELVREDLADEEGGPGVSLGLITPLAKLDEPPPELDDLINAAADRYGTDPFIADAIVDLQASRAPESEEDLRREQVEKWRRVAAEADGMLRAIHLQRALEVAKGHRLSDLVDEIRVELQELKPEDFDLKSVSAEVEVPLEEIRRLIQSVVGDDSAAEALRRFGSHGPPGGTPEDEDERISELREAAPTQFLFPQVVLASDESTTLFVANTDESYQRWARAQQRANYARFWSLFAGDILDEIQQRYEPSRDELTELFTTDLIDEPTAERISRAVELFWSGQPDEAAHVLAPRIESVFRALARVLGVPTYLEPEGMTPGRERSLSWILDQVEPVFAGGALGWHAYLKNLLIDPLGLNLRNSIAHGLRDRVDQGEAALLIQAACVLRLLKLENREPTPQAEG